MLRLLLQSDLSTFMSGRVGEVQLLKNPLGRIPMKSRAFDQENKDSGYSKPHRPHGTS